MKEKEINVGDEIYQIKICVLSRQIEDSFHKDGIFIEKLNIRYITRQKIGLLGNNCIYFLNLPYDEHKMYIYKTNIIIHNEDEDVTELSSIIYVTKFPNKNMIVEIKEKFIKNLKIDNTILFDGFEFKLDNLKIKN